MEIWGLLGLRGVLLRWGRLDTRSCTVADRVLDTLNISITSQLCPATSVADSGGCPFNVNYLLQHLSMLRPLHGVFPPAPKFDYLIIPSSTTINGFIGQFPIPGHHSLLLLPA